MVVVSYRPTALLERCLESVLGQADEVVLVDNGSADGEAGKIAQRVGARFVRLRRNVGFAAGVNEGVSRTKGDVVALLNDDAIAGDGWLQTASGLLEDATIAAVGPKVVLAGRYLEVLLDDEPWWGPGDLRPLGRRITSATLGDSDVLEDLVGAGIHRLEAGQHAPGAALPPPERWRWTAGRAPFYVPLLEGTGEVELCLNGQHVRPTRVVDLVNSAGAYLREDGYVGDIGADAADDERFDTTEERFSLSGAAFVTTRQTFERVGRFEQRYFAYYEDADWCWRARLMGLRMMYEPAVKVRHRRGATSGGVTSKRVQYFAERNRLLTLLRNAPLGLALGETWRKRRGGGDDGVAEVLGRLVPRALGERALLRRHWQLTSREVFDRWAGVDVSALSVVGH